jgi:hypothetical protein
MAIALEKTCFASVLAEDTELIQGKYETALSERGEVW